MAWYSSSMSYLVTVDGRVSRSMLSVVVFQAPEGQWDTAKAKAISVGRLQQQAYVNDDGEAVEWRLTAVGTLDYLGTELTDGREIYSEPRDAADADIQSESAPRPEGSEPGSCGV